MHQSARLCACLCVPINNLGHQQNTEIAHALNESLVEWLLVEEDVRVSELLVEPILYLLHAHNDTIDVGVASENDEGSVRTACERIGDRLWVEVFVSRSRLVGRI